MSLDQKIVESQYRRYTLSARLYGDGWYIRVIGVGCMAQVNFKRGPFKGSSGALLSGRHYVDSVLFHYASFR